jgi:hypothetical protein
MSLFSTGYAGVVANPPNIVNARNWGGMLHSVYDVYAPGVNLTNGWVVRIAQVPAGARVRGGVIDITNPFGAAGTQANFGFAGAATALLTNQALNAATQVVLDREARGVGVLVPGAHGTNTDLIMTVTGVVTPVATGRLVVYLDYLL